MEAGEGELELRLDAGRLEHPHVGRQAAGLFEQGGLAQAGVADQDQCPAATAPRLVEKCRDAPKDPFAPDEHFADRNGTTTREIPEAETRASSPCSSGCGTSPSRCSSAASPHGSRPGWSPRGNRAERRARHPGGRRRDPRAARARRRCGGPLWSARLTFVDETRFEEVGTISFGNGHALRFRTVAEGTLEPSAEPGLRHGSAAWIIDGGAGALQGATGRIVSNFLLSDTGDLTDNQLGVLFLPDSERKDA